MAETTLNTLKLKLDPSSELDQGIKILLNRSEDLSLDGTESVNRIIRQLHVEDFQQLIHLHLQNNVEFTHIINRKVVFPNLTTLSVSSCDHLRFLFSFSMAKSLVELKHLEISTCHSIEEIVSTGECGEENMDNMFNKLEDLKLCDLPNLARFCTASYIEFQALKNLEIVKCSNMGAFITCKEIEQWDAEENLDLKSETVVRYCLFNEKVGFPGLERLKINQARKLETIWHIQLSGRDSFHRLRQVEVSECYNLINIFPPSEVIGGSSEEICVIGDPLFLNLEILEVERCSRLKNLESSSVSFRNIKTLKVIGCEGLEYLMTYSVAKKFVQLATMEVRSCERIVVIVGSNIVGDDAAPNEITFSRLEQLKLSDLPSLRGFCSSRNCIVKVPSSRTLMVELCPIKLTISPDGLLVQEAVSDIEQSYNQLNDKELKPLFLLCGITMRGKYISFEDLLRYGMGLGFFGKDFKVEKARDVLHSRIKKLKDFCLLTDSSDNRYVRMLDRVRDVAKQIALRDQHILSLAEDGHLHELKEWTDQYFLEKCTIMSFPSSNNIPSLPEVMHCPALKMFLLQGDLDDGLQKIPPRFFEKMNNLKVLSLRCMTIPSLPPSFQSLKNLDALCLDKCILGDVALIGELSNLEILSFSESNIKQLPGEVGKLTHLRLLDLSDCSNLEVISPGVISSLGRLEELRMRNSFNKWEVEGERSNANLSELKHLSQLSALEVHIPNADILPANLFSHKLERFNIIIGDAYMWEKRMTETTLNALKVKLTTASIEELDEGLKFLVKRTEDLSLYAEGMNTIVHSLNTEDFGHLKHLQLQSNSDFNHIINKEVLFPNLRTLRVHRCDRPSFLFSFSMPESLAELKHLEISTCEIMEERLSSTR
ncbi:putative leucine-rich repeat domain, L domain-containing protein [Rosa chinensis]|uniref:Putative leucine-rich repeat domain, L domain-containing protein n=1 Tax=Rosa chinensis TaxID=74649 RepID=A0A2P6PH29_ROSCH|nr:probable disease resistance protein At4g27220 [Rosa chinensis]PRQ21217.1 putative leucine-rich repeat domain, L domain-containing protein [Rosa chinensis]